jgi:hypothetical protein
MSNPKYQCPQCKSANHRIDIEATIRCALVQIDDNDIYLDSAHADEGEEHWDDRSRAWCCSCPYSGPLASFRIRSGKKVIMHGHRCTETDAPLFWSNQDGWVDLGSASVFEADEVVRMPREAWGTVELP